MITTDNIRLEVETAPVGLPNVLRNPSGIRGAWAWNTPVANTKMTSTGSALSLTTTTSQATYAYTEASAIAVGQYATGRIDITGITASHNVRVRMEWLDSTRTLLSQSAQSASANTGTLYVTTAQAPASTAFYRLRIDLYNGTGTTNAAANAQVTFNQAMLTYNSTNSFVTQRTNLIPNPSAETNASGWVFADGTAAQRTGAQSFRGSWSVRTLGDQGELRSPSFAVTAGQTISGSVRIYSGYRARDYSLSLVMFDSSGNNSYGDLQNGTETLNGWKLASGSFTVPDGITSAALSLVWYGQGANDAHYIDAAIAEVGAMPGAYFDGSSTAAGKTYAWTGTTNNSTSTESTTGGFDFVDSKAWLNITPFVTSIQTDKSLLDPGTLVFTLKEPTLDPAKSTALRIGKTVRVFDFASGNQFWEGVISDPSTTYELDRKTGRTIPNITVTALDNVATMANVVRPKGVATVNELPGIMEGAGVPWNTGTVGGNQITSFTIANSDQDASLLDQVALTRDTDAAYAWVDRFNVFNAQRRSDMPTAPVATFSDAKGTTFSYTDIPTTYSSTGIINQVSITANKYNAKNSKIKQTTYGPYDNLPSQKLYGVRSADYTLLGNWTNATAQTYANNVMSANGTPATKAASITIPVKNNAYAAMVAQLNNYDVVRITFGTILVNSDVRITGISHEVTPNGWFVTLTFADIGFAAQPRKTAKAKAARTSYDALSYADGTDTEETWIAMSLSGSGFGTFGSPYAVVGYQIKSGICYLKGLITGGTVGNTIITLPAGARPGERRVFSCVATNNTSARVDVTTAGTVVFVAGNSTTYLSLDGISFPIDQ